MAALATQTLVDAGTAPTFGATTASDTAEIGNGTNVFVVYRNDDASPHSVTVVAPGNTSYGVANPDPVIAVPANGQVWIPLRKAYDDGTGRATITGGDGNHLTVAVVRV